MGKLRASGIQVGVETKNNNKKKSRRCRVEGGLESQCCVVVIFWIRAMRAPGGLICVGWMADACGRAVKLAWGSGGGCSAAGGQQSRGKREAGMGGRACWCWACLRCARWSRRACSRSRPVQLGSARVWE